MQKLKSVVCLILPLAMQNVIAAPLTSEVSTLIEGSYIVTFKDPVGVERPFIDAPNLNRKNEKDFVPVPFGEHSTGQSKTEVEKALSLNGKVNRIFDTINAAHILMDTNEAYRLSLDKRVKHVEQERKIYPQATQFNPGWALDRLDQSTTTLNNQYNYTNTGAGRTIYILDTGLALANPAVAAEFGSRASIFYDFNPGGNGNDCFVDAVGNPGHGTQVASVAGGNTKGVAKGVTLKIVKITTGCTDSGGIANGIASFNWLASNAPRGTIANYSYGYNLNSCNTTAFDAALENAVKAAHSAGTIVVTAAGNDGCNTANVSPTNIPEAFVVGATNNSLLGSGRDAKTWFSRTGWNISAFAPGENVNAINPFGNGVSVNGTSFSSPYIAGVFAVACQTAGTYCNSAATADMYNAIRNTGTVGTVSNTNGTPLTGATPRFIWQQW